MPVKYQPWDATQLIKATITAVEGQFTSPSITAYFNPKELTFDKAVPWALHKNTQGDSPTLEYSSSQPMMFNCELMFDCFEADTSSNPTAKDVYTTYIEPLTNLVLVDSSLSHPPNCLFSWGTNGAMQFQGVIEDLNVKYTLFLPDGTPARTPPMQLKMKQAATTMNKQEQQTAAARTNQTPAAAPPAPNGTQPKGPGCDKSRAQRQLMPTSTEPPVSGTADVRVYLNGTQVPTMAQHSVVVEMDINQPDMCTATLRNGPTDGYSKNNKMGDEIEIKIIPVGATDQVSIFKGDIVGIEPSWDVKGESKVIFRALNKLHRMGHTKVSKSYMSMSDKDMANAVAQECGLTLNTGTNPPDSTVWPHTYRHHQTALEFLQDRGGRFNYEFRVSDTTLYYSKRDLTTDSGIQCQFGYQAPAGDPPTIVTLQKFTARIINQSQVGTMKVFGYDPAQAKAVVASVDATVVLGSKGGLPACGRRPERRADPRRL